MAHTSRYIAGDRSIVAPNARLLLAAAWVVAGTAGCDPCVSYCENSSECQPSHDCGDSCERIYYIADAQGCREVYDTWITCMDGIGEGCLNQVPCAAEANALEECRTEFCDSNPGGLGCYLP
jgi:hypothetical protein